MATHWFVFCLFTNFIQPTIWQPLIVKSSDRQDRKNTTTEICFCTIKLPSTITKISYWTLTMSSCSPLRSYLTTLLDDHSRLSPDDILLVKDDAVPTPASYSSRPSRRSRRQRRSSVKNEDERRNRERRQSFGPPSRPLRQRSMEKYDEMHSNYDPASQLGAVTFSSSTSSSTKTTTPIARATNPKCSVQGLVADSWRISHISKTQSPIKQGVLPRSASSGNRLTEYLKGAGNMVKTATTVKQITRKSSSFDKDKILCQRRDTRWIAQGTERTTRR